MYLKLCDKCSGKNTVDDLAWSPLSILNLINNQTKKLQLYVSSLNDIQQIRLGNFRPDMRYITLLDLKKAVGDMINQQMKQFGINYSFEIGSSENIELEHTPFSADL